MIYEPPYPRAMALTTLPLLCAVRIAALNSSDPQDLQLPLRHLAKYVSPGPSAHRSRLFWPRSSRYALKFGYCCERSVVDPVFSFSHHNNLPWWLFPYTIFRLSSRLPSS
jgi:hypothetical protein